MVEIMAPREHLCLSWLYELETVWNRIFKCLQVLFMPSNVCSNQRSYMVVKLDLRQREKSRINCSQMRFPRSLSSVTLRDRIKSDEIRNKWNVEEIIDDIQNYQVKWNQHVLRMPENRLPRKSLQYQPQGKMDLGRPDRRWKDQFM